MTALLRPGADRVLRHALLGLQFRDAVDGRVVADGLAVQIVDLWQPRRRQALVAGPGGVFGLHAFAGLRGFGDDEIDSPPEPGRFRVDVHDRLGRYVDTALQPALPGAGLWSPAGAGTSPPGLPPHVPLFSAATRAVPVGQAALRAELRRADRPDEPAAWARLELWLGAHRIAEGRADAAGRVLMVFPLPRPREATLGTSPAGRPPAFEWVVTLRAFWQRALGPGTVPDLDTLAVQPEAALRASPSPAAPLPPLTLRAGHPLQAAQAPRSFVYVAD